MGCVLKDKNYLVKINVHFVLGQKQDKWSIRNR